jgi:hypothetical protein
MRRSEAPVPAPAPAPVAQVSAPKPAKSPANQQQQAADKDKAAVAPMDTDEQQGEDYTRLPTTLDTTVEKFDVDSALSATIIKPGARRFCPSSVWLVVFLLTSFQGRLLLLFCRSCCCLWSLLYVPGKSWVKSAQKALLAAPTTTSMGKEDQRKERNRAFDLLDALSRSGALPVDMASLHVVVASTHCFDKTLLDTVVKDNINPIEKLERSTLIVASTVHNQPVSQLIKHEQAARVQQVSVAVSFSFDFLAVVCLYVILFLMLLTPLLAVLAHAFPRGHAAVNAGAGRSCRAWRAGAALSRAAGDCEIAVVAMQKQNSIYIPIST